MFFKGKKIEILCLNMDINTSRIFSLSEPKRVMLSNVDYMKTDFFFFFLARDSFFFLF